MYIIINCNLFILLFQSVFILHFSFLIAWLGDRTSSALNVEIGKKKIFNSCTINFNMSLFSNCQNLFPDVKP